ncbi:hypothetical protein FAI40_00900 [Acetobacteraceae bacterium]|nr:hypothetical protein FAI40_00900 [Acetobacteraceae bacterium]
MFLSDHVQGVNGNFFYVGGPNCVRYSTYSSNNPQTISCFNSKKQFTGNRPALTAMEVQVALQREAMAHEQAQQNMNSLNRSLAIQNQGLAIENGLSMQGIAIGNGLAAGRY